ncbi:hypothetical protein Tco_0225861, partial [Tanacetum coccineum]
MEDHVSVYVLEAEEDPADDPVDYAADDDDDDDESSDDDDDVEDEEEEEHLAPADPTAVASPVVDPFPFGKETEPFKTYEYAATPPIPPAYRTTARMSVSGR